MTDLTAGLSFIMYRYCSGCVCRISSPSGSNDSDGELCLKCTKSVDSNPAGGGWQRKRHESLEEMNSDDIQHDIDADGNFVVPDE